MEEHSQAMAAGNRDDASRRAIAAAVARLKCAKLAQAFVRDLLAFAAASMAVGTALHLLEAPAAATIAGMTALCLLPPIALAMFRAGRLDPLGLAKDADDRLGAKDTLSSAVDFLCRGAAGSPAQEWMCRQTLAAAEQIAARVRPAAVYPIRLPGMLLLILAVAAGANVAVRLPWRDAGTRSHRAADDSTPGAPDRISPTTIASAPDSPRARDEARDIIKPIALPPADAAKTPDASRSTADSSNAATAAGEQPKSPDGRIARDEFADAVTRIDADKVKDLELQKSGGKQADVPALKLDQATIEQMLQGLKDQKEERKKDEVTAQVAVGIQAKAPAGGKLTSGSPGGGGNEGGGESAMKTEDTRVAAKRVRVSYVEMPIGIEGVKGRQRPESDKEARESGRVGDAGMLVSRKGVQVEQPLADTPLIVEPAAKSAASGAGWIPFGAKECVQRYFELLKPQETRK